MYIGELSALTGASRKAIRLYEEMGLIPEPERKGHYRVYGDGDVVLVRMIKRAQGVGFKLSELKDLVELKVAAKRFPIEKANSLIALKRKRLQQEMESLRQTEGRLLALQEEINRQYG